MIEEKYEPKYTTIPQGHQTQHDVMEDILAQLKVITEILLFTHGGLLYTARRNPSPIIPSDEEVEIMFSP